MELSPRKYPRMLAALLTIVAVVGCGRIHAQAPPAVPSQTSPAPIFQRLLPADQLNFMAQYAGAESGELFRQKQFRKLMKEIVPDCMFHYGRDMPPSDALELALKGSRVPVLLREGRYVTVSGENGPYLDGRGLVWFDVQAGIGLAAFYFHPTNGEPTPALTVFGRQVKEKTLEISDLPVEFVRDLSAWAEDARLPPITTRYFITGANRRILLEHDEDFCALTDRNGAPLGGVCSQMNADAADLDLTAAYYLKQVNYAPNATAWMISGPEMTSWIQFRTNTCAVGPNPLGCQIRLTRERIGIIVGRRPAPHPGLHP